MQGELRYQVKADDLPRLREGQAVVWYEGDQTLEIEQPAQLTRRQPILLSGSASAALDVRLKFPKTSAESEAAHSRSKLVAQAYFRGRSVRKETIVERHPTPTRRIVRIPPPPGGGVVVRTDLLAMKKLGFGAGAIAIVLDASGSMAAAPGQKGLSKFHEATQALRGVLAKLPTGTIISLWIFGEAISEAKKTEIAELTIRRLQRPVAWKPELLEPLMKEVAGIQPWNESPILRTMLQAAGDLRGTIGPKTLLVLTDGMDNRWAIDRQSNPGGLDVATALRSYFDRQDVAVNVIGYRADPAERDQVRAQFEGVKKFHEPGLFETADASHDLIAKLELAMQPALRYTITQGENRTVDDSPLGFEVQDVQAGSLGKPRVLESGSYQLRLRTTDDPSCRFIINDGDWLLVRITNTLRGPSFDRDLYSNVVFGVRQPREDSLSGWRLWAIQNQFVEPSKLQMTATFEKRSDRREPILQVVRPREIWFDLKPVGDDSPRSGTSLRVADQWGYPAAAWKLDVSGWPATPGSSSPATPVLQVWWDADNEAVPAALIERRREFTLNDDLGGYRFAIDGLPGTIESVQVEDHEVDVGKGTKETRACLVVRVAYPKNRPIWARPYGLAIEGSEHRLYEHDGKYTGLFWPVTRTQADTALQRLGFISIEAFRRDAQRRGATLRLDNLETPGSQDVPPPPLGKASVPRPPDPSVPSADASQPQPARTR